jgi:hypothetical protein
LDKEEFQWLLTAAANANANPTDTKQSTGDGERAPLEK